MTPDGQITVQSIRLDASFTDQSIIGYVTVDKGQSELGVVQGGSLDILTEKVVRRLNPERKSFLRKPIWISEHLKVNPPRVKCLSKSKLRSRKEDVYDHERVNCGRSGVIALGALVASVVEAVVAVAVVLSVRHRHKQDLEESIWHHRISSSLAEMPKECLSEIFNRKAHESGEIRYQESRGGKKQKLMKKRRLCLPNEHLSENPSAILPVTKIFPQLLRLKAPIEAVVQ